jgi:hypothetical protein
MSNFFRDNEDGCTTLVYVSALKSWICGGSLGQFHGYTPDFSFFTRDNIEGITSNDAITAIAVNSEESIIALALNDHITIRDFSDLDTVMVDSIGKRNKSLTYSCFNSKGTHL